MQINPFVMLAAFLLTYSPYPLSAQQFDLSKSKKRIETYLHSGQYNQEISNITKAATAYIHQRTEKNHRHHAEKLAMILDIDETSLSNAPAIMSGQFSDDEKRFKHLKKGNDPAIQPTLTLYKQAKKEGVTLFFVTGRRDQLCPATKKNLLRAGYTQWAAVYCRPQHDEASSIIPFKTAMRKKITQQGYIIIANMGDQKSDLKGGYAERTYKLPNPFYFLP